MKPRKHKHKETFSILLISNTGQNSKQFHVSHFFLRLLTFFVVILCIAFGWLMYQYWTDIETKFADSGFGRKESAGESETQTELMERLAEQEKLVAQLEEEKDSLSRQNDA